MRWDIYENKYMDFAKKRNVSDAYINESLSYAKNLYDQQLPIIYDQKHLSKLMGIDEEYLHRMSNAPEFFYRTFYILKRNGKKRRIDEPLPDLKKVQTWILTEILYKIACSKFAKAYVPKSSIRDNVRFHKKQKIVVTVDLKDFFNSIKSGRVLNLFLEIGYNVPVAVMLTHLCCFKEAVPQGAPTSAYLSNLVMVKFDYKISKYCIENKIRYTRYADDLTFSGDFSIAKLLNLLDYELTLLGLKRNDKKFKVMRKGTSQKVTGIVVNEKIQLPREYRMKIRQEIYYITKYGLDNHLSHIKESRIHYLEHLLGKINYALFVNPNDEKMQEYLVIVNSYKNIN